MADSKSIVNLVAERDALRAQLEEMQQAELDRQQAEEPLRFSQFLIDHAADGVEYFPNDGGGNCIRLTKYFSQGP